MKSSRAYILRTKEKKCNSYLFAQKGDFSDVVIDFDNDKFVFSESKRCDRRIVSILSEEEARLSEILKYQGMREYFWKMDGQLSLMKINIESSFVFKIFIKVHLVKWLVNTYFIKN